MGQVLCPIRVRDSAYILRHQDCLLGSQLLGQMMNIDCIDQPIVVKKTDVIQKCQPAKVLIVVGV